MKKVMLALGVVAFFSLASCNKERTCTCTVDGESTPVTIAKGKKSDQESACDNLEATYKMSDASASCTLD